MLKFIAKIFGTKSEKDIKTLMPLVDKINQEYAQFAGISDDELRKKTTDIQEQINAKRHRRSDSRIASKN